MQELCDALHRQHVPVLHWGSTPPAGSSNSSHFVLLSTAGQEHGFDFDADVDYDRLSYEVGSCGRL